MRSIKTIRIIASGFAVLLVPMMIISCRDAKTAVNAGSDGIAIKGYDTVAYFRMGKPVKGSGQFVHEWNGARWLFASREHAALFAADPEKYAPRYGGY